MSTNSEEILIHGELCAGISGFGAGLAEAGIKTVFHVEIDKDCQHVLRRHYPDTLLLSDIHDAGKHNLPYVDILSCGFPCQPFSMAGLRGGFGDARGNIFFEALRIVRELQPKYFVWENVPGLLSQDNGNAFKLILDEITASGYIVDINILDAQNFGVAQRRRRLFAICQHVETLLNQRTLTSLSIILKMVTEVLLTILIEARGPFNIAPFVWESKNIFNAVGLQKRMNLLKITTREAWNGLLSNLLETLESYQNEPKSWEYHFLSPLDGIQTVLDTELSGLKTEEIDGPYGNILRLWSSIWDERFASQNVSTISMALKQTTELKIYICAEIVNIISSYILHWNDFCQNYCDSALSVLTTYEGYMNYARQTASTLFTELRWLHNYSDYLFRDERRRKMFARRDIGAERCAEILSFVSRSSGDTKPSKKKGERVTHSLAASVRGTGDGHGGVVAFTVRGGDGHGGKGYLESDAAMTLGGQKQWVADIAPSVKASSPSKQNGGSDPIAGEMVVFGGNNGAEIEVSTSISAHGSGRYDFESETFVVDARNGNIDKDVTGEGLRGPRADGNDNLVIGTLQSHAKKHGHAMSTQQAAEEGQLIVTPFDTTQLTSKENGSNPQPNDPCHPLAQQGHPPVISFAWQQGVSENDRSYPVRAGDYAGSVSATRTDAVASSSIGVRRLTPVECCRLQSFPDDWNEWGIDEKGNRVELSDSARYRQLGNAVCKNVARWLGKRLVAVHRDAEVGV